MKITILFPENPNKGGFPLAPPILEYMAGLTRTHRPDCEIELIDANRRKVAPEDIRTDLLGISLMTPSAPWGYRFADQCRARGIPVVLGGIHPSALPDEAAQHADAVVVGEAESVWATVLDDAASRRLQPLYHGQRLPLENMAPAAVGSLRGHYPFRGVFTSRGCIHKCSFCSVRKFFGDTVRYRSVGDVVRDVMNIPGRIWYNGDDNIWGNDLRRTIDLFKALADAPKKKWWFGQGDLMSVQRQRGDELLRWAHRSGLRSVWVGYESDDDSTLASYRAQSKQGRDRESALRKIQDSGIEVVLFLILGGRDGRLEDFDRAMELSDRLRLTVHPILLTPYPGTELYEEYRPFLYPELNWDVYDGVHGVFEHPDPAMPPEIRAERILRLNRDLFTWPRIRKRVLQIDRKGFPVAHMVAFMKQMAMRRGFNRAYQAFCGDHATRLARQQA
jgi:radical SAM superfamily enzyme YgiQ (UPF0313 family)